MESTNVVVNELTDVDFYNTFNSIHTILIVICFTIMAFGIFRFLKSLFRK